MQNTVIKTRLTNSIFLSARYTISVDDFYNQNGPTAFVDRIAAVLNIPLYMVRIIGIQSGSTIINCYVDSQYQNNTDPTNAALAVTELQNLQSILINSASNGSLNVLGSSLLSFNSSLVIANQTQNTTDSQATSVSDQRLKTILISVIVTSVVIMIVVGGIMMWRYQRKKRLLKVDVEGSDSRNSNRKPSAKVSPELHQQYEKIEPNITSMGSLCKMERVDEESDASCSRPILMTSPTDACIRGSSERPRSPFSGDLSQFSDETKDDMRPLTPIIKIESTNPAL